MAIGDGCWLFICLKKVFSIAFPENVYRLFSQMRFWLK